MHKELLHLWGPFSINSFGLSIALGLCVFTFLLYRHPLRKTYITDDHFFYLLSQGILATLIGGRLLYVVQNWDSLESIIDVFAFWQGGLSIMGGIFTCTLTTLYYLWKFTIPIAQTTDVISHYAPLLQFFGRIGCFLAGCCYGIATSSWWSITYTDQQSFAPLYTPLIPTQLYSAAIFLLIFVILKSSSNYLFPGQTTCLYLMLASTERFVIDFWRADREFLAPSHESLFSVHQLIALVVAMVCLCVYLIIHRSYRSHRHEYI